MNLIFNSMSRLKTNYVGEDCCVAWCVLQIAQATEVSMSLHGSTWSKVYFCGSLVRSMSPSTWWTHSSMAFACGFFTEVGVGFIAKSCKGGKKSFLNSVPLSKMTFLGRGYLASHVVLNNWLILALDFSFSGSSIISNQPVAGSIKVIVIKVRSLPVLLVTVYGPTKSTHTMSHGVVAAVLCSNFPYFFFVFLYFWHVLYLFIRIGTYILFHAIPVHGGS